MLCLILLKASCWNFHVYVNQASTLSMLYSIIFFYSIVDILNSSWYLIRAQVVVCFNHWSVFVLTFSKICWIKQHGVHFCPPKLQQVSCFGATDGYLFCCAIERQWKSELQCSPSFLAPNQYYPASTSSLIGIFECNTSCTHHFRTSKHSPNMVICMNCSEWMVMVELLLAERQWGILHLWRLVVCLVDGYIQHGTFEGCLFPQKVSRSVHKPDASVHPGLCI